MSEKRLKNYVMNNLYGQCHFSIVESPDTSAGIPDVNYCTNGVEGWIEFKWGVGNKLPHLRPTQSVWFRMRTKVGGKPFLLLGRGDKDFWLIEGKNVPDLVQARTWEDWINAASVHWRKTINFPELLSWMQHSKPTPRG